MDKLSRFNSAARERVTWLTLRKQPARHVLYNQPAQLKRENVILAGIYVLLRSKPMSHNDEGEARRVKRKDETRVLQLSPPSGRSKTPFRPANYQYEGVSGCLA